METCLLYLHCVHRAASAGRKTRQLLSVQTTHFAAEAVFVALAAGVRLRLTGGIEGRCQQTICFATAPTSAAPVRTVDAVLQRLPIPRLLRGPDWCFGPGETTVLCVQARVVDAASEIWLQEYDCHSGTFVREGLLFPAGNVLAGSMLVCRGSVLVLGVRERKHWTLRAFEYTTLTALRETYLVCAELVCLSVGADGLLYVLSSPPETLTPLVIRPSGIRRAGHVVCKFIPGLDMPYLCSELAAGSDGQFAVIYLQKVVLFSNERRVCQTLMRYPMQKMCMWFEGPCLYVFDHRSKMLHVFV